MTHNSPPSPQGIAEQQAQEQATMSLLEHLGELRSRLLKSLLAVLVLFCVALSMTTTIIEFLKRPLIQALGTTNPGLHFTGPMDVFLASIKVSFLCSLVSACPIWIYQFWKFIEPALYEKERRYIVPFIIASISLFIIGVSFCYFGILPIALEFLISLGSEVATPVITISDYLSMITLMIFGFGLVFETPLILILLASVDLITWHGLVKARRYVIVGVLFIGAILTPPDPLSQIGMAVPLYIMYEISIIVIRLISKNRDRSSQNEAC